MIAYLAGMQATNAERELRLIQSGVVKHRCFSYVYVQKVPGIPYYCKGHPEALALCVQNKIGIMMDSGVFSVRKYKLWLEASGKNADAVNPDAYIDAYVEYCKAYGHEWDWYATVDWEPNAPEIYKLQKALLQRGIRPTPVFHGDKSVEYLRRYHDLGHNFIAIGGGFGTKGGTYIKNKRQHLDSVFNMGAKLGLEFHGLAMTSVWQMENYAWRSVDSSSWSRAAGFGTIMRFNPATERMSALHVSERISTAKASSNSLSKDTMVAVRRELADEGYDYDELRQDLVARHIYNAHTMLKLTQYVDKRRSHKIIWEPVI